MDASHEKDYPYTPINIWVWFSFRLLFSHCKIEKRNWCRNYFFTKIIEWDIKIVIFYIFIVLILWFRNISKRLKNHYTIQDGIVWWASSFSYLFFEKHFLESFFFFFGHLLIIFHLIKETKKRKLKFFFCFFCKSN